MTTESTTVDARIVELEKSSDKTDKAIVRIYNTLGEIQKRCEETNRIVDMYLAAGRAGDVDSVHSRMDLNDARLFSLDDKVNNAIPQIEDHTKTLKVMLAVLVSGIIGVSIALFLEKGCM